MVSDHLLIPDHVPARRRTVGQVMTKPTTIEPAAHLAAAVYLLAHSRDSALVVTIDGTHEPIALITEAEITRAVARGRCLESTRVSEVVTATLVTVRPDAGVVDAARLMLSRKVWYLPVVEHGRLVGIVELADLYRQSLTPISALAGTP